MNMSLSLVQSHSQDNHFMQCKIVQQYGYLIWLPCFQKSILMKGCVPIRTVLANMFAFLLNYQ